MTSNFADPLLSWFPNNNSYIEEIQNIFCQHWQILDQKRQESIDDINKWRSDCRKQINKFAAEQTAILNDNYNYLRCTFDKEHKENLETANAYYVARQQDLFEELRDACLSLKFQVATLKFCKHEIERPIVNIEEEQVQRKTSADVCKDTRNDARRRRRHLKNNNNNIENDNNGTASAISNLTTPNPKQTIDQQSSQTNLNIKEDLSKFDSDELKSQQQKKDDDYINKCPICFMIFPLSMASNDRQRHVNEHMIDDVDNSDT